METLNYCCVSAGSFSQADARFKKGRNAQCTAISACAIAFSVLKNRSFMTRKEIDNLLIDGDALYHRILPQLPENELFLEVSNLPPSFKAFNITINIDSITWVFSSFFPLHTDDKEQCVCTLTTSLTNYFGQAGQQEGILFTGQSSTFSCWSNGLKYFLFNSHGVGINNSVDMSDANNVASLFCCENIYSLAHLLLINSACDGIKRSYNVDRIIISTHLDVNQTLLASDLSESFSQNSLQGLYSDTAMLSSPEKKRGRGRPSKIQTGRPTKSNTTPAKYDYDRFRHLPANLRKSGNIAKYSGPDLNKITLFTLKNESLLSPYVYKCPHCKAGLFEEEKVKKKFCCGLGEYNVTNLPFLDADFYSHPDFKRRPRMYNELFAFSALVIPQGWQHQKTGMSFVKILGKLYHKVFDLAYSGSYINSCALYIDDGEARGNWATQEKLNLFIVQAISSYLHENNPFINVFKKLQDEPSENAHLIFENTTRRIHGPNIGDKPLGYEVAAILSNETETYYPRKIAVWKIGAKKPHTVDVFHPLYEAFQYPLLYPQGTPGWHLGILTNSGKKLTQLEYVRCLLLSQSRFGEFNRLSETWVVDMYARIEEERLRFLYHTQKKSELRTALRTAPLDEIEAALSADVQIVRDIVGDETIQGEGGALPGRIYLPSSFTGGPRYMKIKYLNAMAIVGRMGGPTFFLTFTASARWSEIKQSKRPGSNNQPDVIARVFHSKFLELLRDIRSGAFFGTLSYLIWVVEFQKRGLPHAHIVFRVADGEGAPVQAADIDRYIRADIPGFEEADGRLRQLVLSHMIHGPCGPPYRTNLPCWDSQNHRCTKYFPKQNPELTYIDSYGFVHYRRNTENKASITYKGKNLEINDTWVVPYNAALLLKYDCHLNLEIASNRKVIKYLFKYLTKGNPLASVAVVTDKNLKNEVPENPNNEIEQYVTKRYIGSSDAVWRILQFDLTGFEPTVICLPVHLEGKHSVYFQPGDEAQAAQRSSSKLIIYFNRPHLPEFDNLTYLQFFDNYLIHSSLPKTKSVPIIKHPDNRHYITRRQRGRCISRMFWVAPNRGEQFYLRLLLNVLPCRGYKDLIARGGDGFSTLQQAARVLGLINDQQEFSHALAEASVFMTGSRLRSFFVLICNVGAPAALLWENFKTNLSEDFLQREPENPEKAHQLALKKIDRLLRRHGSSLREQGLPHVQQNSTELSRELINYNQPQLKIFVEQWLPKLSKEQLTVFNHIAKLISGTEKATEDNAIFLDGPGGYGKTVILQVIAAHLRSQGKVVLCVASSGIAALNLEGGSTAHSMFRLPVDPGDGTGFWSLTTGMQRAALIRAASLIIFDEISMANRMTVEILERSLRDLMQRKELFGGKAIILAGDFRQCAPVLSLMKTPSEVVSISLRSSGLWEHFKKFQLTQPQRTRDEELYSTFLLKIGNDEVQYRIFGDGRERQLLVPLRGITPVASVSDLVKFVFPKDVLLNPDACASRAILCTLNTNVHEINLSVLESLNGPLLNLYSVDWVEEEDAAGDLIDGETLNQAQGKGVPQHNLVLKIGVICIITRNLNFCDRLVNGTKVIVVATSPRIITVRKPGEKDLFAIPRIVFKFPLHLGCPLQMYRRQFPLQVCYALSIHKSQGQTIDLVGVDLRSDVFSHGQLYVSLSRVRSPENIRVLVQPDRVLDGIAYVKNIVYKQLLLSL